MAEHSAIRQCCKVRWVWLKRWKNAQHRILPTIAALNVCNCNSDFQLAMNRHHSKWASNGSSLIAISTHPITAHAIHFHCNIVFDGFFLSVGVADWLRWLPIMVAICWRCSGASIAAAAQLVASAFSLTQINKMKQFKMRTSVYSSYHFIAHAMLFIIMSDSVWTLGQ